MTEPSSAGTIPNEGAQKFVGILHFPISPKLTVHMGCWGHYFGHTGLVGAAIVCAICVRHILYAHDTP